MPKLKEQAMDIETAMEKANAIQSDSSAPSTAREIVDEMEVEVKPKMKLLFENESALNDGHLPKEVDLFLSSTEASATLPPVTTTNSESEVITPKRKLLALVDDMQSDSQHSSSEKQHNSTEEREAQRLAKKRKSSMSMTESLTEIESPDDVSPREITRKDSLMVCSFVAFRYAFSCFYALFF
jgi:hypothetical protein